MRVYKNVIKPDVGSESEDDGDENNSNNNDDVYLAQDQAYFDNIEHGSSNPSLQLMNDQVEVLSDNSDALSKQTNSKQTNQQSFLKWNPAAMKSNFAKRQKTDNFIFVIA